MIELIFGAILTDEVVGAAEEPDENKGADQTGDP
jgi:hypothetical protein